MVYQSSHLVALYWLIRFQCIGFVNKWTEMIGLRVILGVFEAGLYPGAVYLLATWYSRCRFTRTRMLPGPPIDSVR